MTARSPADTPPATAKAKAAATRVAKGSVQEAIGKLIGDDAAQARGTAEKEAGAQDADTTTSSSRPRP